MIDPPPASLSAGIAAVIPLNTPVRLIAMILSQSARRYWSIGP